MNDSTKNPTIRLLNSYTEINQKIALLKFELQHLPRILQQDIIDEINFQKPNEFNVGHESSFADKTMYTATTYKEKLALRQRQTAAEIVVRLLPLEDVIARLEQYVSLLPEKEQQIVISFYFQNKTMLQITDIMDISKRTAFILKKTAIHHLSCFYDYTKTTIPAHIYE